MDPAKVSYPNWYPSLIQFDHHVVHSIFSQGGVPVPSRIWGLSSPCKTSCSHQWVPFALRCSPAVIIAIHQPLYGLSCFHSLCLCRSCFCLFFAFVARCDCRFLMVDPDSFCWICEDIAVNIADPESQSLSSYKDWNIHLLVARFAALWKTITKIQEWCSLILNRGDPIFYDRNTCEPISEVEW